MSILSSLLLRIISHLFAEKIDGKRFVCGLLPDKPDERDVQYGWAFNVFDYKPSRKVVDIGTVTIKDQGSLNNCTFQSATVQKEVDEGVALSARDLTIEAVKRGRVSGNGFSTLRQAQQTLIDAGVCEQNLLPEDERNWYAYSDAKTITYSASMNGELHKNKSFSPVSSRSEWLHALEAGRVIHTGGKWYTSYNMSGGLQAPYKLTLNKGLYVGGHAFICKGYDLNKNLYKFQNSYGPGYGDNGCFYVDINEWHSQGNAGYVSIDDDNFASAIQAYEGKDVKADNNPRIYRIEKGAKRWYPDEETFRAHVGVFEPASFIRISGSLLNSAPDAENMTI